MNESSPWLFSLFSLLKYRADHSKPSGFQVSWGSGGELGWSSPEGWGFLGNQPRDGVWNTLLEMTQLETMTSCCDQGNDGSRAGSVSPAWGHCRGWHSNNEGSALAVIPHRAVPCDQAPSLGPTQPRGAAQQSHWGRAGALFGVWSPEWGESTGDPAASTGCPRGGTESRAVAPKDAL